MYYLRLITLTLALGLLASCAASSRGTLEEMALECGAVKYEAIVPFFGAFSYGRTRDCATPEATPEAAKEG
jgi:hypothetical protein